MKTRKISSRTINRVNAIPHVRSNSVLHDSHGALVYYFVSTKKQLQVLLRYYNSLELDHSCCVNPTIFTLPCTIGFWESEYGDAERTEDIGFYKKHWALFIQEVEAMQREAETGFPYLEYKLPYSDELVRVFLRVADYDHSLEIVLHHHNEKDAGLEFAKVTVGLWQLPTYYAAINDCSRGKDMIAFLLEHNLAKHHSTRLSPDGKEYAIMAFNPALLRRYDPLGCAAYEKATAANMLRPGRVPAFQIKDDFGEVLAVIRAKNGYDAVEMYTLMSDPAQKERDLRANEMGAEDGLYYTRKGLVRAVLVEGSLIPSAEGHYSVKKGDTQK